MRSFFVQFICRSWINNVTDKVFVVGDIIKRPELGKTLERLALSADPVELFYRGDIAQRLVKEIQNNGWFFYSLLPGIVFFLFSFLSHKSDMVRKIK